MEAHYEISVPTCPADNPYLNVLDLRRCHPCSDCVKVGLVSS
jgi:hypothetical protein